MPPPSALLARTDGNTVTISLVSTATCANREMQSPSPTQHASRTADGSVELISLPPPCRPPRGQE
eukprot:323843-Prorocentrum_lima.AAC.1